MKFHRMVQSLLDTDLYKFNMLYVMWLEMNGDNGTYVFRDRKNRKYTAEMVAEIKAQIKALCKMSFKEDELEYLFGIGLYSQEFIDYLRGFKLKSSTITVRHNPDQTLELWINGKLKDVMMFEIYLLSIISETFCRMSGNYEEKRQEAKRRLDKKIQAFKDGTYTIKFADFCTRRRMSFEWNFYMVQRFVNETNAMIGTSNVYIAKKLGIMQIGTFAHEIVQAFQAIGGKPVDCNERILEVWYNTFQGKNGIALTDTIGTEAFLLDFNEKWANLYQGVRHDSGDPIRWGEMMILHYESLGIDPKTKTLLFSDGLDFDKAQVIYDHFNGRINVSFGIGTFVGNDTGEEPPNIVIKLQKVNGNPVAKLSDVPGKTMCLTEEYVEALREEIQRRLQSSEYIQKIRIRVAELQ